jgi:chromosome segregation ATPase
MRFKRFKKIDLILYTLILNNKNMETLTECEFLNDRIDELNDLIEEYLKLDETDERYSYKDSNIKFWQDEIAELETKLNNL